MSDALSTSTEEIIITIALEVLFHMVHILQYGLYVSCSSFNIQCFGIETCA